MTQRTRLNICDGTERDDRFPPPLGEGYFLPDEISFETALAQSAEFAAMLGFHTLENRTEGNWAELFMNDEAVIMARLLSIDLKKIEAEFMTLLRRSPDCLNPALYLCRLGWDLDHWFRRLNDREGVAEQSLSLSIEAAVRNRLAAELHGIGEIIRRLERGGERYTSGFARFHPIWGVGASGAGMFPRAPVRGAESPEQCRRFVTSAFDSFASGLSFLQAAARHHLERSLGSRRHNPAMALFIAFLHLMGTARQKANDFTRRHLDFYYNDLLRSASRAAAPDHAHLLFQASGHSGAFIPRGTPFPAGRDDKGNQAVYRADNDLAVVAARVTSLRTLYFERDPLISPERELGYVTRILAGDPLGDASGRHANGPPRHVFGAPDGEIGPLTSEEAELGFAVASPLLLLGEGRREIRVTIRFNREIEGRDSVSTALQRLREARCQSEFCGTFGALFGQYLFGGDELLSGADKLEIIRHAASFMPGESANLVRNLLSQDRIDLFFRLTSRIFTVDLTAESGWHDVPRLFVSPLTDPPGKTESGLDCSFRLDHDAPPIVPYDRTLHGGGFQTALPLARFRIRSTANLCPYSLLVGHCIRDIAIETRVSGVRELMAYNQHGRLDPSQPFLPFGPFPAVNSYFAITAPELSVKPLTSLELNLEWSDLPTLEGGFRLHYQGYETRYDNASFKAEMSVLRDGRWRPDRQEMRSSTVLFDQSGEGERISPRKTIAVDVIRHLKPTEFGQGTAEPRFGLKTRNGFVKFTLTEPEAAFGHREHPLVMTRVLTENAKRKRVRKAQQLPAPPYTPQISSLSLDYTARSVIHPGGEGVRESAGLGEKLFHLHPFGVETVYPSAPKTGLSLLPGYGGNGNLFIGISAERIAGTLTLFFQMREDSNHAVTRRSSPLTWHVMSSNRWHSLENVRVVSDSTDGFQSSGIVTLDLPEGLSSEQCVMPDGLFWLRVSSDGATDSFCSLYAVHTNALRVTRQMDGGEGATVSAPLPAGSITSPGMSIPGLGATLQPAAGFGGRERENWTEQVIRLSERLRHKNRAVLPWDYERLVLEHFPAVFKVTCFGALGSERGWAPHPGRVLVVVVPRGESSGETPNLSPMLNAAELNRISEFLRQHSPPFASIEVRNPAYERIHVRCSVKLTAAAEARRGHYLKELNRVITEYLSPWSGVGCRARFGWRIRREDIEAYLLKQEYVECIAAFSLLRTSEDGQRNHGLSDTARPPLGEGGRPFHGTEPATSDLLEPLWPWSLAIPAERHLVETMSSIGFPEPEPTGIDHLEVGQTFIIDN